MKKKESKESRKSKEHKDFKLPKDMNDFEKACHDPVWSGMKNHVLENPKFTGVARTVICKRNGQFPNYQILTLFMDEGVLVRSFVSDFYLSFEAKEKLLAWSAIAFDHLQLTWEEGKLCQK